MSAEPDGRGGGVAASARLRAVVQGDVQGVGFRAFVLDRARTLELSGWVRNRDDGTVECVAEGPRANLERFAAHLREGPALSDVTHVDGRWEDARGDLVGFKLRG